MSSASMHLLHRGQKVEPPLCLRWAVWTRQKIWVRRDRRVEGRKAAGKGEPPQGADGSRLGGHSRLLWAMYDPPLKAHGMENVPTGQAACGRAPIHARGATGAVHVERFQADGALRPAEILDRNLIATLQKLVQLREPLWGWRRNLGRRRWWYEALRAEAAPYRIVDAEDDHVDDETGDHEWENMRHDVERLETWR